MNRTQEKRALKATVKQLQEKMVETLKNPIKEDSEEMKEAHKANLGIVRGNLDIAKKKLALFLMNKTGSKFFEWIPSLTANRAARRRFKKMINKRA